MSATLAHPLSPRDKYDVTNVNGSSVSFVSPKYFYSSPVPNMGQGLFCSIDLVPGDIWWVNSMRDSRFVERIIPWETHKLRNPEERADDEIKCYLDSSLRALVICTEPFCRVNHGLIGASANAASDELGNSYMTKSTKAGEQILIPYDYEAVVSVLWKFPNLAEHLEFNQLNDEAFLLSSVKDHPDILTFLESIK